MNIAEEFGLDRENFIWQDLSMCLNLHPEIFFEGADKFEPVRESAKEICRYCPVFDMCKQATVEGKEFGVRAGEVYERGKIVGS